MPHLVPEEDARADTGKTERKVEILGFVIVKIDYQPHALETLIRCLVT